MHNRNPSEPALITSVTITGHELKAALEHMAPDGDENQLDGEILIAWKNSGEIVDQDDNPSEAGYYAWNPEYPEEGCFPLTQNLKSSIQAQKEIESAGAEANTSFEKQAGSSAKEKIIMLDGPEAAQFRTDISGWVARNNPYAYQGPNAEEAARYQGCTHIPCEQCGTPTEKHHSKCDACCEMADIARYAAMPRAEWDEISMLYSDAKNRYYDHPESAESDLAEGETLADLRLVICEPNYARRLDPDDYVDDIADDGGELPEELLSAIEAFNASVAGTVLSWSPGKTALLLDDGASR